MNVRENYFFGNSQNYYYRVCYEQNDNEKNLEILTINTEYSSTLCLWFLYYTLYRSNLAPMFLNQSSLPWCQHQRKSHKIIKSVEIDSPPPQSKIIC